MGKKGGLIVNKNDYKKESSNNPTSATKNTNEEGASGTPFAANSTVVAGSNLKSFEHLLESLIQTQNQCRDEQAQNFAQLQVSTLKFG